jgi:hypothetical protein
VGWSGAEVESGERRFIIMQLIGFNSKKVFANREIERSDHLSA